jgi:glycosyltransferase involved in cell wall biosynthesis
MISYSIVICIFNQKQTLGMILDSLREQIKQPKIFEIVIADDGSTDGTGEFVKKLRYPIFLKYARAESNQGRAVNRNRGFEKASGKKVICIDGDMAPGPGFMEAYFCAWDEFPSAVILGARRPPPNWEKDRLTKYLYSRGRLPMTHGAQLEERLFTSDNFAIDKQLFTELSGFDTAFGGWGGEDTDFGLRLKKKSIPLYYIPEAWCYHYHRKSLDDMAREFESFGRSGFPLLVEKYPDEVIYQDGWMIGLPDLRAGMQKKTVATLLMPFRISPMLRLLARFGKIQQGRFFSNFMYDWLFYGYLAKGYRSSLK